MGTIQHKRSGVAAKVPAPGDLSPGEFAINTADGKAYLKDDGGTVRVVGWQSKADIGLGNVDNTSDANKPISTATQTALDLKAPSSHVGAGAAAHAAATTSVNGFMSAADKTKLDGVAAGANAYTHPSGDGNLHVPTTGTGNDGKVLKAGATAGSASWQALGKADVGLGNVDNTTDAGKPVSTAQQAALNLKANLAGPTFTGTPTAPTATAGTNTTQLATTAFVKAAVDAAIGGTIDGGTY